MLILILALVGTIFGGFVVASLFTYDAEDSGFIAFIGLVIVLVILIPVLIFRSSLSYEIQVVESETNIVSLERGAGSSGSFTLGIGSIDNVDYYYAYTETGTNSYELLKVKAHDTTIIESDVEEPRVVNITNTHSNFARTWLLHEDYERIIYVPHGYITKFSE